MNELLECFRISRPITDGSLSFATENEFCIEDFFVAQMKVDPTSRKYCEVDSGIVLQRRQLQGSE